MKLSQYFADTWVFVFSSARCVMARVIFETWILPSEYFDHPSTKEGAKSHTCTQSSRSCRPTRSKLESRAVVGLIKNVILSPGHVAGSSSSFENCIPLNA